MTITLTVVDSFATPGSAPSGLAVDGAGRMWVNDFTSGTIYEIDPADGSTITSYAAPAGNPRGMAWDGTYLRVLTTAGADAIHRVDVDTGSGVDSIAPPGSIRQQLAWDSADSTLWMSDTGNVGDEPIINIDPSDGSEISRFLVGGVPNGLFVYDGFVYVMNTAPPDPPVSSGPPVLLKHDPSDGSIVDYSNQVGGGLATDATAGMAFDGTYIWVVSTTDDTIYKLAGFVAVGGWHVGRIVKSA